MNFVNEYSELIQYKGKTNRDRVRKLSLDVISTGYRFSHSYRKLFRIPRIQFLYIHHVFNDEVQKLDALMHALSRDHHFISHSEAVDKILNGTIDRSYIAISSDDGLKNNLSAARVLNKYGASGCFFICPSIVGEDKFDTIRSFTTDRLHFPPVEFLSWADVDALQQQGHEIGAHTLSHINIARSGAEVVKEEIAGCYRVIKERCGKAEHFAYPYGRFSDFSETGRRIVLETGFSSCSSAQRGCHIVQPGVKMAAEELLIRRDHVILAWPLEHILYFIAHNAAKASIENNFYQDLCA